MNFSAAEMCLLIFCYVTFLNMGMDIKCFGIIKGASFAIKDYNMAAAKGNHSEYSTIQACFTFPHLSEAATTLQEAATGCSLIRLFAS